MAGVPHGICQKGTRQAAGWRLKSRHTTEVACPRSATTGLVSLMQPSMQPQAPQAAHIVMPG